MVSRKIEASDFYAEGLMVVGRRNIRVVDETHVELDDNGRIIRAYKEEKPKPKPRAKPKAKKES